MSKPKPNLPEPPRPREGEPEYEPDLVKLRDRLAQDGVMSQIPRKGAKLNLPAPIQVEGEAASEIIIRRRHAE